MAPEGGRIQTIDFWRGVALATIFVNHIPGNIFEQFTPRNFGFSDASEIFVLLAGIATAFAYGSRATPATMPRLSLKIVIRAFQIYMTHIVTIVACGAIICFAMLRLEDPRVLEAMQFDGIVNDSVSALVGLATLGLQPPYMNILPLYVALLVMAPFFIMLCAWSSRAALLISGALYVVTQLLALKLWSFPGADTWFFNPLAWQFLFVIGLCIGKQIHAHGLPRPSRWLVGAGLVFLAGALVATRMQVFGTFDLSPLPRFIWDFDKTNLSLPRLAHVLVLAAVLCALPTERWLGTAAPNPLTLMGRHSLPIFATGTILSIIGQLLRIANVGDVAVDYAFIPAGLLAMMGLAWVLEWNDRGLQRHALPAR